MVATLAKLIEHEGKPGLRLTVIDASPAVAVIIMDTKNNKKFRQREREALTPPTPSTPAPQFWFRMSNCDF